MKRIGFFLETYPSVTEHFVLNELIEFKNEEVDFELFALRKGKKTSIKSDQLQANYFSLKESVLGIHFFFNIKLIRNFFFIYNQYRGAKKRTVVEFLKYLKRLFIALKLIEEFKKRKINHIHTHFAFITTEIAYLMYLIDGISFSFSCHAKDIYTNELAKLQDFIREATFVITCTKGNLKYLNKITKNGFNNKVHHVYHGVDFELFKEKENDVIFDDLLEIICVARLVEKKGIKYLLKSLIFLKQSGRKFKCQIIGDGPMRKEYELYCKYNNLESEVFFLGSLPHNKVLNTIQASNIFVLPCVIASDGDRDGLPNTIVEAMLLGKIVITTRTSAASEIIDHNENGVLIDSKCSISIYNEINKIISNPKIYDLISRNARNTIIKDLSIKYSTKKLISLYKNYLSEAS